MITLNTKGFRRIVMLAGYCLIFTPALIVLSLWSTAEASTTLALRLITFHGSGYTIDYPWGWNVKAGAHSGTEIFIGPRGSATSFLIRVIPNSNGELPSSFVLTASAESFVGKQHTCHDTIASTHTIIGRANWSQRIFICSGSAGNSPIEVAVLADNHPVHSFKTRFFLIIYESTQNEFHLQRSVFFLPMLRSFVFR